MGKPPCNYKYNVKWEREFSWVTADPLSKNRAVCKYCKTDMKAKLDVLRDHGNGKKHKARIPFANVKSKIPFQPVKVIPDEVKKAELKGHSHKKSVFDYCFKQ
jgi:hypothetical protein